MPNKKPNVPEQRYPTGLTTWGPLPDTTDWHIMWSGPSARLQLCLGDPTNTGTGSTLIEHPAADGSYDSLAQARTAVAAFIEATSKS